MDNKENKEVVSQSRWQSPVVWAAIVGVIAAAFSAFGVWDKIGITAEGFNELVGAIGTLLAAFGIVNNPTKKNGF